MTNKSPAYQWYPKDALSSQRLGEMTLEEEGAYRRALDSCWLHGSIPADPERLARIIGKGCSVNASQMVLKMFIPDCNDATRMVHDRLEKERQKQAEWREKSALGGRSGKGKRKNRKKLPIEKGGSILVATKTQPNGKQNDTLQSPVSCLQTDKKRSAQPLTVKDLITELCADPFYAGIEVSREIEKMRRWLAKNPGRKFTRKFAENWLEKVDREIPIATNGHSKKGCDVCLKSEYVARMSLKPGEVYDKARNVVTKCECVKK